MASETGSRERLARRSEPAPNHGYIGPGAELRRTICGGAPRRRAAWVGRPFTVQSRARNRRVLEVIRADTRGKLPFFCECGMEYCLNSVWLTLTEAREVMEGGGLIIGAHVFQDLDARLAHAG